MYVLSRDTTIRGLRMSAAELTINWQIRDGLGNDYGRPKNVVGESRTAFTSLGDGAFDVCFENILDNGTPPVVVVNNSSPIPSPQPVYISNMK